ncbi:MAG: MBL fold metallo-hydrolase [Chloroflexi bacterium]|nr:MBL fold metallo-hydrolase [Chloroflexota bacterium]
MKQILPGLWEIDEIGDAVHCYLWEWQQGLTLIDSGFPKDARTILDAIVKRGYALHNVRRVIVTHADLDHTGGLAQIKKATGARVACHTVEKVLLEHPGQRKPAAWFLRPLFALARLWPAYRQAPVTPDELMVDGQELPEGFTVVHTPGHTPGHISLLHKEKRFLIAGDALSNRNGKLQAPVRAFTPDEKNAQRSIWKLAKKYGDDFEVMVFGHGPPITQNASKRVKGLVSQIFSADV